MYHILWAAGSIYYRLKLLNMGHEVQWDRAEMLQKCHVFWMFDQMNKEKISSGWNTHRFRPIIYIIIKCNLSSTTLCSACLGHFCDLYMHSGKRGNFQISVTIFLTNRWKNFYKDFFFSHTCFFNQHPPPLFFFTQLNNMQCEIKSNLGAYKIKKHQFFISDSDSSNLVTGLKVPRVNTVRMPKAYY